MNQITGIEKEIELKRTELNQAGDKWGLRSEYVIQLSMELDHLFNEFQNKMTTNRLVK